MPYEFTAWPEEPELRPSAAKSGKPPRKPVGTDLLDPPDPIQADAPAIPKRWLSWFVAALLVALGMGLIWWLSHIF